MAVKFAPTAREPRGRGPRTKAQLRRLRGDVEAERRRRQRNKKEAQTTRLSDRLSDVARVLA